MKKKYRITVSLSIVLFILIVSFVILRPEKGEEYIQITNRDTLKSAPAIYEDKIVWAEEMKNGKYGIYLYDLSTKHEELLMEGNSRKCNLLIYGNNIVYGDNRNGNFDIFIYNILNKKEIQITDEFVDQYPTGIYNDKVVWSDNRYGNYDIFMYDITSEKEIQITCDKADQSQPTIYMDKVVWYDNKKGSRNIAIYNISSKKEIIIDGHIPILSLPYLPAIYENKVFWIADGPCGHQVYMYNISSEDGGFITCDLGVHPRTVSVYNSEIIWLDNGRETFVPEKQNIYVYNYFFDTLIKVTQDNKCRSLPAIYDNIVTWAEYRDNSDCADICMYEIK